MLTEFNRHFLKDLDKITQAAVKREIKEIIEEVERSNSLSEVKNLKKLKGHANAYRIRSGDYRIGLYVGDNIVQFVRIAHRKDIYKIFP